MAAKTKSGNVKGRSPIAKKGKVDLGDGQIVPYTPHVQGISSSDDDLWIGSHKWKSELGDSIEDSKLERTVDGASQITLAIEDPKRVLLESDLLTDDTTPFKVKIDDLGFTYAAINFQGVLDPIELTFEDEQVAAMRAQTGARKASRGKVTRAEFLRSLVKEIKPTIPFFCPALHVRQPIATAPQGRANQSAKNVRRDHGLSPSANVTVKHSKASSAQIRVIERVLDTGMSLNASADVLTMAIMCITQENTASASNPFQQNADWPGDPNDIENAARNFYARAPTYPGGAIAWRRKNPHGSLGDGVQAIQRAGAGQLYSQWQSEASNTVKTYLGGTSAGSSSTTPTVDPNKFQFERKPGESTWDCGIRLAQEVNWRFFVSAGVCYFVADADLMRSKVRATITDATPGVENLSFKKDRGMPIDEMQVTARARAWGVPPGSVVEVKRHGPANGLWLVSKIASSLRRRNSQVTITLKRPGAALPEPLPSASSSSGKKGSVRSAQGTPAKVSRVNDRMKQLAGWNIPYVWGGGHGGFSQHPRGLDCSGAVCDALHAGDLIPSPMVSGALARWGSPGAGQFITVYANGQHAWMEILVNGKWEPWGTSVGDSGHGGLGFHPTPTASYKAQYTKRHPPGL